MTQVELQAKRIEALEVALREILIGKRQEDLNHPLGEWFSMAGRSLRIARAAFDEPAISPTTTDATQ